jgi:hypothetical protein
VSAVVATGLNVLYEFEYECGELLDWPAGLSSEIVRKRRQGEKKAKAMSID